MTKRIVLCADDFGQAPAISEGIIALLGKSRLSATSCIVNAFCWREFAYKLIPFKNQVDLGLHFNLTEGKPLSSLFRQVYGEALLSLPVLMHKAFLHQLDQSAILAECHAQLDCFEEAMGFLPDFLDGHQHIHQFPIIRHVLVNVYESRLRSQKTYIRLANEKISMMDWLKQPKKVVIYFAGAKAFKQLLKRHDIPHNNSFGGIYSFDQAMHYQDLFPKFLQKIGDGGLVMCHPGLKSQEAGDSIAKARYKEYQYLASDQFLEECKKQDVLIVKASEAGILPRKEAV